MKIRPVYIAVKGFNICVTAKHLSCISTDVILVIDARRNEFAKRKKQGLIGALYEMETVLTDKIHFPQWSMTAELRIICKIIQIWDSKCKLITHLVMILLLISVTPF